MTDSPPLIFSTIHGSRLYGLATSESDFDWYHVHEGSDTKLHQTVTDTNGHVVDSVRCSLEGLVQRALSGSHQSLEALFSPQKRWGEGMYEKYGAFIASFRVTGGEVFAKYERTIRAFCYGDFKRRRHAIRLACNLYDLRKHGRFNPEMNGIQITLANKIAGRYEGDDLVRLCDLPMRRDEKPNPQTR